MSIVYLSIGSNLGDRLSALKRACKSIESQVGNLSSVSSVYETEAWGYQGKPYLNQVVCVMTGLSPHDLLDEILEIELCLGRKNRSGVYEDRIIDIDILLYDDLVMTSHDLVIPHPHMQERKFVLFPLQELSAALIHPQIGKTVAQLLDDLNDHSPLRPVICAIPT